MKRIALWIFPLWFLSPFLFGMGDEPHDTHIYTAPSEVAGQTYNGTGKVKSIAEDHMSLRIFHDPIPELKWPAMNMRFEVIDHDLTHLLEVGDTVRFEFIQKEGKQIITKISK
jgi:Cu/Ag efflux protein CusF